MPRVEGRARELRPGRQRYAWLIPACASGGVASEIGRAWPDARQAVFLVVGVVAGVAWQLLYRRDLVSRLTFLAVICAAVLVVVLPASLLGVGRFEWDVTTTQGLYGVGVLLGLIFTEHHQRWSDRRAERQQASRERTSASTP